MIDMGDTPITDLYEFIMPEVSNCPEPVVIQAIRLVLRQFYTQTQKYLYKTSPITVKKDIQDYQILNYPDDWYVERVYSVLRYANESDTTGTQLKDGIDWYGPVNDVVRLVFIPQEDLAQGLVVQVVLVPLMTVDTVPTEHWQEHFQDWANGTKAYLMKMLGTQWANPQLAEVYYRMYKTGETDAKIKRARVNVNAPLWFKPEFKF